MRSGRVLVAGGLVVVALVLQVAVFPHLAWEGIVPDFCLLVVVAAALVRGPAFAATLGFFAGLLLDLAPPADHVAGRWALALVLVGYVAGLMRQDTRPTVGTIVATVAASSFVGTSVYALTGLVLGDAVAGAGDVARVILVALLWDVLLAPFVVPVLMRLFTRLEPAGAR
ncbi:MAG: rod shape-determining protein MreD [Nocardioides sp.]